MPKNPRDMRDGYQPRVVRIVRDGQAYNGHFYRVGDPPRVEVCYATGSASAPIGKADEMTVAKRLLTQIVAGP